MSDSAPDLGAMVSKLLENPDLLSQIASTVGIDASLPVKNTEENKRSEEKTEEVNAEAKPAGAQPGGIDQLLPMLSMMGGGKSAVGKSASSRCALLSALKPFCNEHRCRTIDYMIGISKLSETLIPTKRG